MEKVPTDSRVWAARMWSRRQFLARGSAALAGATLLAGCASEGEQEATQRPGKPTGTLSLLAWVGYEEDGILEPFKEQTGLDVRVKTFVGADEMVAILKPSRETYDAVIVCAEFVEQLTDKLEPLDPADFDLSHYLPTFQENHPLAVIDGTWYAVVARWGVNGISYNTEKLAPSDVESYEILESPELEGRIGIWDWYLPSMGTFSAASNYPEPYFLDENQFSELTDYMSAIRPNVGAIFPTPAEMISGLGSGQVWAIPAGAEWVSAILANQGRPVDWAVPRKGRNGEELQWGGIMWAECVGIVKDAPNPDAALAYAKYMTTAKGNALMAVREAYSSQVCSADAVSLLPPAWAKVLHSTDVDKVAETASLVYPRQTPEDPQKWQDAWSRFKAS